jgi:hypothetical protein
VNNEIKMKKKRLRNNIYEIREIRNKREKEIKRMKV